MHADHHRLSPHDEHYAIELAIKNGDLACARELVREALAHQPSADLWYLAALVARSEQQRHHCLQRALALNPEHQLAHAALEASSSAATQPRRPPSLAQRLQRLVGSRAGLFNNRTGGKLERVGRLTTGEVGKR